MATKLNRLIKYLVNEAAGSCDFISTRESPSAANKSVMKLQRVKHKLLKKKKKGELQ